VTPSEKNIVRSLIAVAWADGKVQAGELGVIEGLLCGFDASEEEERELLQYASQPRSLARDVPLAQLGFQDRELLLQNAALLVASDGIQSNVEAAVLHELSDLLGFSGAQLQDAVHQAFIKPSSPPED
jgi:uncharacterized membrane protein YebE (DUF533 family)